MPFWESSPEQSLSYILATTVGLSVALRTLRWEKNGEANSDSHKHLEIFETWFIKPEVTNSIDTITGVFSLAEMTWNKGYYYFYPVEDKYFLKL